MLEIELRYASGTVNLRYVVQGGCFSRVLSRRAKVFLSFLLALIFVGALNYLFVISRIVVTRIPSSFGSRCSAIRVGRNRYRCTKHFRRSVVNVPRRYVYSVKAKFHKRCSPRPS